MTASKEKILRVCEYCGKSFYAQKSTTRYCSKQCNSYAYKAARRKEKIKVAETMSQRKASEKSMSEILAKEYLTIHEVAILLGLSKQTIYNMVYSGKLRASKITSRLSFIRKRDADYLVDSLPYTKKDSLTNPQTNNGASSTSSEVVKELPVPEYYSAKEIAEVHHTYDTAIYEIAKKTKISRISIRGKVYWNKKEVDDYFAKQTPDPTITEWMSVMDIQQKYCMTKNAVYSFMNHNAIPRKMEGNYVLYSKRHVEMAKGETVENTLYYSIPEAMKLYGLSQDQIYKRIKKYGIEKVKIGKYIKISKRDLEKAIGKPTVI